MSTLLFVDESGQDGFASPYAVLAGVAIRDELVWNFVCQLQEAEERFFGCRISENNLELKAKKLLKAKTYRHAGQLEPVPPEERRRLALACLTKGRAAAESGQPTAPVTRNELVSLAQAKIAFVEYILDVCLRLGLRVFASIFPPSAPTPGPEMLRKDYAYLFQRFYNFLSEEPRERGIVVFDEMERSACHLLVGQMHRYFRETAKGRARSSRIIPEPFFVHSDLTTMIQVADLVAYIISWGVRFPPLVAPARPELAPLGARVLQMRHSSRREDEQGRMRQMWSLNFIQDLRPREQRSG